MHGGNTKWLFGALAVAGLCGVSAVTCAQQFPPTQFDAAPFYAPASVPAEATGVPVYPRLAARPGPRLAAKQVPAAPVGEALAARAPVVSVSGERDLADEVAELRAKLEEERNPTLEIKGRIHLDSWTFSRDSEGIDNFENPDTGADPENRIFFRRIRFRFQGSIIDDMVYRMQLDFQSPAEGELKDAYIGFKRLALLQTVLVGNQKRPLGLDHLNSSRFNIFIERPLVVEAFNEDARRLGVCSYGVSNDQAYNWRYGAFILENPVDDGEYIGDSGQWSLNARLASSPWYDESSGGRDYFHWAVAGMFARPDGDVGPDDTNENEARFRTRAELRSDERWLNTGRIAGAEWYEVLGVESILNFGPFQVVGEYQWNWVQRDSTTVGTGPDLFFHGAYVYVAYMLTGEHVPYERKSGTIGRVKPYQNFLSVNRLRSGVRSGWGAWQVAARYSYLDLTDEDIQGGTGNDLTLALVWYFNSHAALQFNAVFGDIEDHAPVNGFTGGHFTALGTRLRIDF